MLALLGLKESTKCQGTGLISFVISRVGYILFDFEKKNKKKTKFFRIKTCFQTFLKKFNCWTNDITQK